MKLPAALSFGMAVVAGIYSRLTLESGQTEWAIIFGVLALLGIALCSACLLISREGR